MKKSLITSLFLAVSALFNFALGQCWETSNWDNSATNCDWQVTFTAVPGSPNFIATGGLSGSEACAGSCGSGSVSITCTNTYSGKSHTFTFSSPTGPPQSWTASPGIFTTGDQCHPTLPYPGHPGTGGQITITTASGSCGTGSFDFNISFN